MISQLNGWWFRSCSRVGSIRNQTWLLYRWRRKNVLIRVTWSSVQSEDLAFNSNEVAEDIPLLFSIHIFMENSKVLFQAQYMMHWRQSSAPTLEFFGLDFFNRNLSRSLQCPGFKPGMGNQWPYRCYWTRTPITLSDWSCGWGWWKLETNNTSRTTHTFLHTAFLTVLKTENTPPYTNIQKGLNYLVITVLNLVKGHQVTIIISESSHLGVNANLGWASCNYIKRA